MADHSRALVEGWFEKLLDKFSLASYTDLVGNQSPHVGDDNDVFQCRIAAKLTEHLEIPVGDSAKPIVGDAVDIDYPGKSGPSLVSVVNLSRKARVRRAPTLRLRGGQVS